MAKRRLIVSNILETCWPSKKPKKSKTRMKSNSLLNIKLRPSLPLKWLNNTTVGYATALIKRKKTI